MSNWMTTASGRDHFVDGPMTLQPENRMSLDDIAHSLATINRYNGHAKRPLSVAEHSILTADIAKHRGAGPMLELACLLHDGHESITGDATSPVKRALGVAWIGFEAPHMAGVRRHFGVQTCYAAHRAEVNRCDLIALATERRDLMEWSAERNLPWPVIDTPGQEVPPADFVDLRWPRFSNWLEWREEFKRRVLELWMPPQP